MSAEILATIDKVRGATSRLTMTIKAARSAPMLERMRYLDQALGALQDVLEAQLVLNTLIAQQWGSLFNDRTES